MQYPWTEAHVCESSLTHTCVWSCANMSPGQIEWGTQTVPIGQVSPPAVRRHEWWTARRIKVPKYTRPHTGGCNCAEGPKGVRFEGGSLLRSPLRGSTARDAEGPFSRWGFSWTRIALRFSMYCLLKRWPVISKHLFLYLRIYFVQLTFCFPYSTAHRRCTHYYQISICDFSSESNADQFYGSVMRKKKHWKPDSAGTE